VDRIDILQFHPVLLQFCCFATAFVLTTIVYHNRDTYGEDCLIDINYLLKD